MSKEELLRQQLADLETKLVESESKRKSLEEKIKFLTEETEENFVDGQKYNQLKHQLVEKEEQLKEELIEKKGLERALSACNRQNDEFADMIKKLVNEKEELKQQLAITEKALELACEEIGRIEAKFGSAYIRANGYLLDYFKTKAKEMLENE